MKPFIRAGSHYVNVNHVVYVASGQAGISAVTSSQRDDVKPFAIHVRGRERRRVQKGT